MNTIFTIIFIFSIMVMIFTNPTGILSAMQKGTLNAVNLSINLVAIYALWLGILEIVDACGLSKMLAKLLRPITRKLFDFKDSETENQVAINISSNMLGMGNASTPSGIKAMKGFDDNSGKINKSMIILFLLNSCAIQIVPSTIIGLRVANNSQNASDIFVPNLLVSFTITIIGVLIALFIEKIRRKK